MVVNTGIEHKRRAFAGCLSPNAGFTLLELLIALGVGSLLLMMISVFFYFQQVSYISQQQLVEMQQNARSAQYFLESELQMAGYDPTGRADAAVTLAEKGRIRFQVDWDGSGAIDTKNETITYALKGDQNDDGQVDKTVRFCDLGRDNGSHLQTIAENIDALNFVYYDADHIRLNDHDGMVDTANLQRIRSIQVAIVARSGKNVPVLFRKYIDANVYKNKPGETILDAPRDQFRRIELLFEVHCRNLF